ncbi:hypothetical protein DDZ16_18350 [Marinilabilia rubra]|uniref:DUF2089 domain-containing protein n=1 Tax=Marinilabilia rubra TaxID=2162893 RepID=A0A2U2B4E7_9BACT|nr:hypothetical protein DDZ16_18350 [Marinilabilia rubra]
MLPITCPGCRSEMQVKSLYCQACDTTITGSFSLPLFLKLEPKEQDFIMKFVQNSGSLKQMSKTLKLSYPTVRNMLDDLIEKINQFKKESHENE